VPLVYKYEVNGVEYESSRASHYGDLSFGRGHKRSEIYAKLEKKLVVYYHPDRHDESYIYYTNLEDIVVGVGIGSFVLMFGLIILIQPEKNPHWVVS
jgi:hypothetical protein